MTIPLRLWVIRKGRPHGRGKVRQPTHKLNSGFVMLLPGNSIFLVLPFANFAVRLGLSLTLALQIVCQSRVFRFVMLH